FWMWLVGLLGMATKFIECTLGTKYRITKDTQVYGGPMYYIQQRLPRFLKPLAYVFAASAVFGAFGAGGMFQANQAASALKSYFNIPTVTTGVILAIGIGLVIIGGIKRIGNVASKIVPTMCIVYILGALAICALNIQNIPSVFAIIFNDAFTGSAVAGGSIGTVVIWGVRRAVFSNEAGLGSASIAHAAVKTNYPIREGIVASVGPFIDTIIVCTATAIVIILGGQYQKSAYTPHDKMINFEAATLSSNPTNTWEIVTMDDGQGKRLKYKKSNNIASFSTPLFTMAEETTTWYGTPQVKLVGDGIQFKTKRNAGDYALFLRDKNGKKIASMRLQGDETFFFVKDIKKESDLNIIYFKLNETPADGTWQTHTIELLHQTNDWIIANPRLHEMSLELVVNKNSTEFEVDDILVGKPKNGIELTIASFDQFLSGFGSIFITIAVVLFAFSTIITWSYYGEVALMFLFGKKAILPFKWIFIGTILLGATIGLDAVINFSDLMIGLMVIPNVIAIIYLMEDVMSDAYDYFQKLKNNQFKRFK
ncbi:MAG: alanine/glycine:cation symporter family protein, partial [Candidatus Marinamargulisbacteria bacterium]